MKTKNFGFRIRVGMLVFSNFMWMFGLVFFIQGFVFKKTATFNGGLYETQIIKSIMQILNFSQSEFSFFVSALMYGVSALIGLFILGCSLMNEFAFKLVKKGGDHE